MPEPTKTAATAAAQTPVLPAKSSSVVTDVNKDAKKDTKTDTKSTDDKFLHPVVALLAELGESSRNLPNLSSNLGTIHLGIQEISKRAHALRKDLPNENSTKAHYLLAGSGVNAENIQAELKSFKSQTEPVAPIDTYEPPQKEESALIAIEELVQNSAVNYDNDLAKHISLEWVVRKKQMTSLFGIGKEGKSSLEGFQKLGTSFPSYFKAFVESADNTLPKNLLDNIRKEFNEQVRFYDEQNSDPFKYALYKLIGRCEAEKKTFPGIVNTAEDWLWTHLVLIQEDVEGADKYTLQSLQLTVTSFGAKYFNPDNKTPGLYVQVLLMCGLFEKAAHYAYTNSIVDGVHYSLALTYYGLLRPVADIMKSRLELLSLNKYDLNELNFARLMGVYTREFRRSDPVDAVEYLILISLNRDQTNLCLEALKELVYETREYATLLGEIGPSGTRIPGAIERRMKLIDETSTKFDVYLREIVMNAAPKAVEDGYISDAVLLYLLNENYDRAVDIVNKALSEQLCQTPLGSFISKPRSVTIAATDDAAQLAQHLTAIFDANPQILTSEIVRPFTIRTCETLLKIVYARDAFAQGQSEVCLQHIDDTGVLVLDPAAEIADVRKGAQRAQHELDPAVARTIPSLLVMVMRCLNLLDARDKTVRMMSRNCMVYAGLLRARMDREVFAELTNLEIRH